MNPLFSPDLSRRALLFAAKAHGCQHWHSTVYLPYIVHPVLVCQEVIAALSVENVSDPNLAAQCALLHDVVEDTSTTIEEIEKEFGTPVADGVQALTKNEHLPEAEQIVDSVNRLLALNSPEAKMVKLADRVVNLTPPYTPHWDNQKKQLYTRDADLIYEKLRSASPFLAARLLTRISAYRDSIK